MNTTGFPQPPVNFPNRSLTKGKTKGKRKKARAKVARFYRRARATPVASDKQLAMRAVVDRFVGDRHARDVVPAPHRLTGKMSLVRDAKRWAARARANKAA